MVELFTLFRAHGLKNGFYIYRLLRRIRSEEGFLESACWKLEKKAREKDFGRLYNEADELRDSVKLLIALSEKKQ
jgi:hypothetical protein